MGELDLLRVDRRRVVMIIYMLVIGTTFGLVGLFVHPVSAELGLTRAR